MNKIPMPNEAEKQAAVRDILEKAQVRPRRLMADMIRTVSRLGFRNLFAGQAEIVFLAAVAALLVAAPFLPLFGRYLYSTAFLLSPLLYLILFYLTFFREWSGDTWQVTAACKTTLRHLTALRMVLFGAVSLLINTVLTPLLYFAEDKTEGLPRLLSVSYCSVFLFALLILVCLPRKRLSAFGAPALLWSVLAVAAAAAGEAMNAFLQRLPLFAALGILTVLLLLFGLCVRNYYYGKGGRACAFGQ